MARNRVKSEQAEALDQALRALFLSLQARALPDSLRTDRPDSLLAQLWDSLSEKEGPEEPDDRT